MGHTTHHAVLVFSHRSATQPDIDAFRAKLDAEHDPWYGTQKVSDLVVGPIKSVTNGHVQYAFLSSGSKDGWDLRAAVVKAQDEFKELFSEKYDDGSTPHIVVTVNVGDSQYVPTEFTTQDRL